MGVKQVIVIRKDLKMRRGKEIAQGSHASISFLTRRLRKQSGSTRSITLTPVMRKWIKDKFRKICVYVESEEELNFIYVAAVSAGLESHIITDAGTTEFGGVPTKTCVAIGPDSDERIDPITGDLPLY